MVFASFMAHAPNGAWPIMTGGELPALYCFAFLHVASRGSDPISLDRLVRGCSAT